MKICKQHELLPLAKNYVPDRPVIVEAGAYKGQDSLRMAQLFPGATLHLFEPVPDIFKQLAENTADIPNVHLWPSALSNHTGTASFYIAEKKGKPGITTQAGSLLQPQERLHYSSIIYPRTIMVPTISLDDWAYKHAISHIDFLWLDLQGHELAVLQHSTHLLKTVSTLFIELHFTKAYQHQPLASEVINWLDEQGFMMVAKDYDNQEQWFFGNGLFVRKCKNI